MRIAAISDLHLGFGDRADRFGHKPSEMLAFLDDLEAQHDLIVVVGDLYETWQGRRLGDMRATFAEIRRTYPKLSARMSTAPYRLIVGNHDPLVEEEGATRQLEIVADGVRMLFTHGHQWDPPLKRTKPLAYTFAFSTGVLNRLDGRAASVVKGLRDRLERRYLYNATVSEATQGQGLPRCPYLRGATALLEHRADVDVIVCGHTHVPARYETPFGTYLGCGALAGGHWSWVELDTHTRTWTLRTGDGTTAAPGGEIWENEHSNRSASRC